MARARPARNTIADSAITTKACGPSGAPKTGPRSSARREVLSGVPSTKAATTVRAARTTSGPVITHGDSWAWLSTSLDMRGAPPEARHGSRHVQKDVLRAPTG